MCHRQNNKNTACGALFDKQQYVALAWTNKDLVQCLILICDLDLDVGEMKSVYDIILSRLEVMGQTETMVYLNMSFLRRADKNIK